jgi:ectoine hydroxylase-related dioxygenase (phytanoyl-CoA dioxygenase family)
MVGSTTSSSGCSGGADQIDNSKLLSADVFKDSYKSGSILKGEPFDEILQLEYSRIFHNEGWLFLKGLLTVKEVDTLKGAMASKAVDHRLRFNSEEDYVRNVSLMRMFEYHQSFRDLIIREPIISLVEKILGTECHVIAQNALITSEGNGIINWHIDDHLYFPFLGKVQKHLNEMQIQELRSKIPCNVLSVMLPLTDVERIEHGPTQLVPRSHFSGECPTMQEEQIFEGQLASSVYAQAGDVYLFNSQIWHRGAQNYSERIRLMATITYGRRFVSQRFYPFLNYHMPSHVFESDDQRLLRLLGKHPKGAYG